MWAGTVGWNTVGWKTGGVAPSKGGMRPSLAKERLSETSGTFLGCRTAYRTWEIKIIDGEFHLCSAFKFSGGSVWPKRKELEAECWVSPYDDRRPPTKRQHDEMPYPTCHCGIYAMNDVEYIKNYQKQIRRNPFLGEVKLWGTVLEYTDGVRAQFAYPLSIADVMCFNCLKYNTLEGATYYISRSGRIISLCIKCVVFKTTRKLLTDEIAPDFLNQIAEDYGIEIGERRLE